MFAAPATLLAEGAVLELDCTTTTLCDGAGACQAAEGPLAVTISPLSVEEGQQLAQVEIGQTSATAFQDGPGAPWVWESEDETSALAPTGPNTLVWFRLFTDQLLPRSEFLFMTCVEAG